MSAQTIALIALGYLAILVVVLAMLAAAGRADRAAGRHAGTVSPQRRFRRRHAVQELARAGRQGAPREPEEKEDAARDRSPLRHPTR